MRTCFLSYVLSVESCKFRNSRREMAGEAHHARVGPRMRRALIVRNAALNAYDELVPWACVSFRVPVEALKAQRSTLRVTATGRVHGAGGGNYSP